MLILFFEVILSLLQFAVEEDNQAAASSTPGSPAAGDDPGEPEDILGLFDGDPPGDPPDDSPDADAPPVQGNPQPLLVRIGCNYIHISVINTTHVIKWPD